MDTSVDVCNYIPILEEVYFRILSHILSVYRGDFVRI